MRFLSALLLMRDQRGLFSAMPLEDGAALTRKAHPIGFGRLREAIPIPGAIEMPIALLLKRAVSVWQSRHEAHGRASV
jgi:hypothetical protein